MRGRPLQYRDFSGGVNLAAGPTGLDENEAALAQNFRPTVRGSLRSRVGDANVLDSTDIGAQAMMSLSGVESLGAGQADTLLASMTDGKLYHYVSGTTATLLGTFTAASAFDFIDAPVSGGQGPVYGVNGTVAKQITTAPAIADWTAATGTLPTNARYLAYISNRVWAAGMSSYGALADAGSALVFSELGDPRNWPAANVVQFDPNDGESITGIGAVSAGLLVFKRSKAWLVYDLDTGANRPLGVGVGCVGHKSIAQTPYGTIWAGDKQVWVSDGSTVRPLGEKIVSAAPASQPGLETYLSGFAYEPTAVYVDNRYLLSVNNTSAPPVLAYVYEYDFTTKAWWVHTSTGGLLALAQIGSATSPGVYAGGLGVLDGLFVSGYLDARGVSLSRFYGGPYLTLGAGKDRLRGMEVEGFGWFGVAAVPDFRGALGVLTSREVRPEKLLGTPSTVSAVRREGDFKPFRGVQPQIYDNAIAGGAVPGYAASDIQIDAITLYTTSRPG